MILQSQKRPLFNNTKYAHGHSPRNQIAQELVNNVLHSFNNMYYKQGTKRVTASSPGNKRGASEEYQISPRENEALGLSYAKQQDENNQQRK